MAATMLGWAARRDELKRPGHERSCAVLKTFEFPPEAVGSYHRILKKESDIDLHYRKILLAIVCPSKAD